MMGPANKAEPSELMGRAEVAPTVGTDCTEPFTTVALVRFDPLVASNLTEKAPRSQGPPETDTSLRRSG